MGPKRENMLIFTHIGQNSRFGHIFTFLAHFLKSLTQVLYIVGISDFFWFFLEEKKFKKSKKIFFFIRVHPKKRGPWDPTSRAARAPKKFLGVPVGSHNGKNLPATWNSKKAVFLNRLLTILFVLFHQCNGNQMDLPWCYLMSHHLDLSNKSTDRAQLRTIFSHSHL